MILITVSSQRHVSPIHLCRIILGPLENILESLIFSTTTKNCKWRRNTFKSAQTECKKRNSLKVTVRLLAFDKIARSFNPFACVRFYLNLLFCVLQSNSKRCLNLAALAARINQHFSRVLWFITEMHAATERTRFRRIRVVNWLHEKSNRNQRNTTKLNPKSKLFNPKNLYINKFAAIEIYLRFIIAQMQKRAQPIYRRQWVPALTPRTEKQLRKKCQILAVGCLFCARRFVWFFRLW